MVDELMELERAFASKKKEAPLRFFFFFFRLLLFFDLDLHSLCPRFFSVSTPPPPPPCLKQKLKITDEDVKNSKFTNPHKGH